MNDKQVKGVIFNIQNFSVHDGEGIRTNVFLKGCPLSCKWCCNPESQSFRPEKAFNPMRCLGLEKCGYCLKVCPTNSIVEKNKIISYNKNLCNGCGKCVKYCPTSAQFFYGEESSVENVLNKVEDDIVFYARSGGGLTLSGGEAMSQPSFTLALLREAKRHHINTAIETSGHCKTEDLYNAAHYLDAIIMDIKSLSNEKHKQFTGVELDLILKNAQMIINEFPHLPITFRTPIVPTFNDTKSEISAIRNFIPRKENIIYELLPYHRFGKPKYDYLQKPYTFHDKTLQSGIMTELRNCAI